MDHGLSLEGFMPHGMCLLWRPEMLLLYVGSDLLIFLSYLSIPVALGYFIAKRTDLEFSWMFALFGVFILACGATHAFGIWTIWNPDYLAAGAVKAITAAASVPTAIMLWRIMPVALAIPSKEAVEAINRDLEAQIGHRRDAESALRRLNAELEQRVQERTAELETTNEVLRREMAEHREAEEKLRQAQKMEAFGQLTSGVAHDFNNLLAVVIGNLELIEEAPAVAGDRQLAELAKVSLRSAYRGAELTEGLLSFARKQPLDPAPTSIDDVVKEMRGLLSRTLGETIEITHVAGAGARKAVVDRSFLESAILNLALNARDAMPHGGTLSIETGTMISDHPQSSGGATMPPGRYVTIAVRDTGTGMSADVAARAFEPFFSTKGVGKGSGLGLSMVYGFVRQSNGLIALESQPGKGTVVRIFLPVASDDAVVHDVPEPAVVPPSPSRPAGVLVVEDDPDVRDLACRTIRALGYAVYSAGDARLALATIKTQPGIDIVLTDVILPGGINGPELARLAAEAKPDIETVFMSGYTDRTTLPDGSAFPAERLIRKPFRKGQIAETLSRFVRRAADHS